MSVKSTVARTRSVSGALMRAGEKLLDLVRDRHRVAEERDVVIARELNELRARDPLGDGTALRDVRRRGRRVRCSTSVGAWMSGNASRTSSSARSSARSRHAPGELPRRSNRAHHCLKRSSWLGPWMSRFCAGPHLTRESLEEPLLLFLGPAVRPVRRPHGLRGRRIEDERSGTLRVASQRTAASSRLRVPRRRSPPSPSRRHP